MSAPPLQPNAYGSGTSSNMGSGQQKFMDFIHQLPSGFNTLMSALHFPTNMPNSITSPNSQTNFINHPMMPPSSPGMPSNSPAGISTNSTPDMSSLLNALQGGGQGVGQGIRGSVGPNGYIAL